MALVKVTCKKCGESTKMDIGNMSKEEINKILRSDKYGFHCFGNHVELGSRSEYWMIDWNSIEEGSAPNEDEFLSKLKSEYSEVHDTKELSEKYDIKGFSYGMCVTVSKNDGKEKIFNFVQSPKGKRFYYA